MRIVARVGECEVWLLDLRASDERYESALALLSHPERARARAIRGEQARRRFVLARAALRVRLGAALEISPERVALRAGEHGKPEIVPPRPHAAVGAAHVSQGPPRFSLAHSYGEALLAINHRRCAVGVDIERIAPESERPWKKLLERICHPSEAREAMAEARAVGSRAFYERWVGKEAVLKALGLGLRASPASVSLRRDGGGELRVEQLPGGRDPVGGSDLEGDHVEAAVRAGARGLGGWRLAAVPTPPGFLGAVALVDR
jgi:4'-phosphopantetheinyl transferase